MNYFSKLSDDGELFVTSLTEETQVIVLSGDYITIWELIQSPSSDGSTSKSYNSNSKLKPIKPFLNFLHFNNFNFEINSKSCEIILSIIDKGISGEFKTFDLDNVSESLYQVYAQKCSPNGTLGYDVYGQAQIECTSNGLTE